MSIERRSTWSGGDWILLVGKGGVWRVAGSQVLGFLPPSWMLRQVPSPEVRQKLIVIAAIFNRVLANTVILALFGILYFLGLMDMRANWGHGQRQLVNNWHGTEQKIKERLKTDMLFFLVFRKLRQGGNEREGGGLSNPMRNFVKDQGVKRCQDQRKLEGKAEAILSFFLYLLALRELQCHAKTAACVRREGNLTGAYSMWN